MFLLSGVLIANLIFLRGKLILYVIYDVFEVEWVLCQVFSLATEWHRFLVVRFVRLWIFSDHFFDEIAVDLIG